MITIYRVRVPWTGEIFETESFKKAYSIARREAKDLIRGSDYIKGEIDVEKCFYMNGSFDDFWNYPIKSIHVVCSFTCTKYLSIVVREKDRKVCII